MGEEQKTQKAGLENEKAFSETLISDSGLTDKKETAPKTEGDGEKTASGKAVAGQPAWVGKIMGHFKLLRQIGQGSMGIVIQAEDTNLKRIVALKVMRKQLSTGEKGKNAVEQFLREARAAASIEHPNIVRVYEINQHAGWWYIATEMINGNSLQEIIKAAGKLPVSRACPIIADAAIALQAAHELNIIHRDIKPSNIMVTRNGHGKVSDFGLVRVDDPNDPFDLYEQRSIGTPYYIAPEMIRREKISPAVDIYSLGATLYHTLTGRPPYTADKIEDILKQHLNASQPDLKEFLPDCSPTLASLVQRMMAKEPGSRPKAGETAAILNTEAIEVLPDMAGITGAGSSTVAQWLGAYQKTATAMPGSTVKTPAAKWFGLLPVKKRAKRIMIYAAAGLLILCGIVFWLHFANGPTKQNRRSVVKLFREAPTSYGVKTSDIAAVISPEPGEIPAFSWKNKVNVSGFRFAASRTGQYFYPIDDKRAVLIRADEFIGYETPQEAMKDGKEPAPRGEK